MAWFCWPRSTCFSFASCHVTIDHHDTLHVTTYQALPFFTCNIKNWEGLGRRLTICSVLYNHNITAKLNPSLTLWCFVCGTHAHTTVNITLVHVKHFSLNYCFSRLTFTIPTYLNVFQNMIFYFITSFLMYTQCTVCILHIVHSQQLHFRWKLFGL